MMPLYSHGAANEPETYDVRDEDGQSLGRIFVAPDATVEQIVKALRSETIIHPRERYGTFTLTTLPDGTGWSLAKYRWRDTTRVYTLQVVD